MLPAGLLRSLRLPRGEGIWVTSLVSPECGPRWSLEGVVGQAISEPISLFAPQLLSPSNVAIYGGLCALATFDRQELQRNVISSRWVGCGALQACAWGVRPIQPSGQRGQVEVGLSPLTSAAPSSYSWSWSHRCATSSSNSTSPSTLRA